MRFALRLRRRAAGALGALLLLSGSSWPLAAANAKAPTAILLLAHDDVSDPDFADSVVLVMNNLGPAPIGIIVNRPTSLPVSRLFPKLKSLAQLPDKVYFGGPVEVESVWFLVRAATPPAHAVQTCPGVYLSADRDLLMQLLAREKPMEGLRIFVGHAGWAPGQLEAEISHGFWSLKTADADAIFNGKSEFPWPSPRGPKAST